MSLQERVSPPTPEDLMLFADGELDRSRADEVTSYLADHPDAEALVLRLRQISAVVSADALAGAERAGADGIADAVMASLEAEFERSSVVARRRIGPRPPVVVALVLAAAAACLVLMRGVHHGPGAKTTAPEGGAADEASMVASAEVESVDFGARAGTIFYVTNAADHSEVPVVWLTDDEPGSESGDPL